MRGWERKKKREGVKKIKGPPRNFIFHLVFEKRKEVGEKDGDRRV